jgi:RNA-binding protein NOB1
MSGWLAAMKKDAPEAKPEDAPAIGGAGVTKVVVDTNAIVKGFRLERFAEEAVTIPEVLQEVRDKQARHTLATLPFELKVRDPDEASLKAVRRFARLTGDLGALSEPDLRVIALAYMLERDAHGVAHLRTEPPPPKLSKHKHDNAAKKPGWDFVENEDDWAELDAMNEQAEREADDVLRRVAAATLASEPPAPTPEIPENARIGHEIKVRMERRKAREEADERHGGGGDVGGGGGDDAAKRAGDEDDGGGWERNVSRTTRIRRAKREQRRAEEAAAAREKTSKTSGEAGAEAEAAEAAEAEAVEEEAAAVARAAAAADSAAAFFRAAPGAIPDEDADEDADAVSECADEAADDHEASDSSSDDSSDSSSSFSSTVCCVTSDYAMQNVLLQMNLRLLTPDGMRISELRRWVLRCHACGDVVRETTRVFCPKCGNATLQKVQRSVTAEGAEHFGARRKHVLRGTRFSLPAPRGGRREKAPLLREDQLIGARVARGRRDEDVFAAEYNEESFAGTSRAAHAGAAHLYRQKDLAESVFGATRKNPNERKHVRTNRRR